VRENRTHGSEGGEGSTLPDPYQVFSPLLNRVPDAGLSIPRLTVVLYMTVRCICSGSAARTPLQVEKPEGGETVGWLGLGGLDHLQAPP
jgi:hypothetical protein